MSTTPQPPDCGHALCLMEAAIHDAGKCTEFDQIVPGVYCPHAECRHKTAHEMERAGAAPLPGMEAT